MATTKAMEINKPASFAAKEKTASLQSSLFSWVEGVKKEAKEISWTSQVELKAYTKLVVASTFLFGLSIYLVDLAIQLVLSIFSNLVHRIS